MKFYITILGMIFLTLIACHKDEESNGLQGSWSMINATGGIAGFNQNYPKGQIVWKFDDGDLAITNNYNGQLNFSYLTGNHHYFEIIPAKQTVLYIDEHQFGDISISNDTLVIDQSSSISDGFLFTFVRQ
ncbi:MAG: hypothetical protein IPL55_15785 [Saprospiraceae bacterium]|nr:hypothetical protein [Saprospiraceae bacterium]MBL0023533.1 hypothetical protein [Saprospiraceae bacterium]